jgi:hypothetical protein
MMDDTPDDSQDFAPGESEDGLLNQTEIHYLTWFDMLGLMASASN